MKRVRCPKCGHPVTFDENTLQPSERLVFECSACHKQFAIRVGTASGQRQPDAPSEDQPAGSLGSIIVVENVFHYRQVIPLEMGDNVFGRFVRGTSINKPIETADPSVDTRHCIIRVQRSRSGQLQYILRDAPSGTGTFYMNDILRDNDRVRLSDGSVVTIGATTLILQLNAEEP